MSEPASMLVVIDRLGVRGDGIAETGDGPVYVPFALPGETWCLPGSGCLRGSGSLRGSGRLPGSEGLPGVAGGAAQLVEAAGDRVEPLCKHFGVCGGCCAQHVPPADYAAWKRGLVVDALAQQGLRDVAVGELVTTGPGTRRRAVLTAERHGKRVTLGYHQRASHTLVAIEMCPILVPAIAERLEPLGALAGQLLRPGDRLRMTVVSAGEGLDVTVSDVTVPDAPDALAALATAARDAGLVRLSVSGVPVFQSAQPTLRVAHQAIPLPPGGAFLQASGVAEAEMRALVVAATGSARFIADLFCGVGTFALALAAEAKVDAFDSDGDAVAALGSAVRTAQGLKPVSARQRDLFREPLSRRELSDYDAVVFDPPRTGAKAQAEMLAKSDVATVVAVSCNPGTFARDAHLLVAGGYELTEVTPIDQFVFSEHVELVAVFRKAPAKADRADRLARMRRGAKR